MIFSVPVWGDFHIKTFLEFSLRSYIDQIPKHSKFFIHTDQFLESEITNKLEGKAEVWYRRRQAGTDPHIASSQAHKEVLRLAKGEPVVFIPPDCAVSWGALPAIQGHLDKGIRLIAVCCLRAKQDPDPLNEFTPRTMMKWLFSNRHDITRRSTWGEEGSTSTPSINLFPTECGAVARAYHLHPIAIRTENADFTGTIDDKLVSQFNHDEVHVVTDSDELAMVEISPDSRTIGNDPSSLTQQKISNFGSKRCNPMHRHFFTQRIVLRARDGSDFHEIEKDL